MADASEVFSNSVLRDLGPVVIVSPGSVETYLRCGGEIFSHLRIKKSHRESVSDIVTKIVSHLPKL